VRADLEDGIAALFHSQTNVHDNEQERDEAMRKDREEEERAMNATKPSAASSFAAATSAASVSASAATPIPPPSPASSQAASSSSRIPNRFLAPHYLRSEHNIIPALSARSLLDLYLSCRQFPRGSLLLLSAINIPDVSVVIRAHGLVPVPVDLEPETMQPDVKEMERIVRKFTGEERATSESGRAQAISDATRSQSRSSSARRTVVALLVAQLYGRRFDMEGVVAIANKYNLDLIEDCAEAFSGLSYIGHPRSDLTFLSFGSIKVCTAFGGGIARVRNANIAENMRRIQRGWDIQTRTTFFAKCLKVTLTMLPLNVPQVASTIMHLSRFFHFDHKRLTVALLRGFPDRLMEHIRTQPSAALLHMLKYRLEGFDEEEFQKHQDVCDLMLELLPHPPSIVVPGVSAPVRHHWLFPILLSTVDDVDGACRLCNDAGVDAYQGATQLALVPVPGDLRDSVPFPRRASDLISRILYLPVHKRVPLTDLIRMATIMHAVIERVERQEAIMKMRERQMQMDETNNAATNGTQPTNLPSKL